MWANYNLLIRMEGGHVEVYPYGLMTKMLRDNFLALYMSIKNYTSMQ